MTRNSKLILLLLACVAIIGVQLGRTYAYTPMLASQEVGVKISVSERNGNALRPYNEDGNPVAEILPAVYFGDSLPAPSVTMQWGDSVSDSFFGNSVKNAVDQITFVKNTGEADVYVRVWFAFEQGNLTDEEAQRLILRNYNDSHWDWSSAAFGVKIDGNTYTVVLAEYKNSSGYFALQKDQTTLHPSLLQVLFDRSMTPEQTQRLDGNYNFNFDVLYCAQASLTADAWQNTDIATDHPWQRQVITNEEMKSMIQTLPDDTDIKTKVKSVILGHPIQYAEIVSGNYVKTVNGGITTYYVPSGDQYDVYVLSKNTIYAPADSTGLFRDMSSLTTVDFSNLDMKYVTDAKYMFRECKNLTSIGDVSGWDLSNVTSTRGMFYNCEKLNGLDVSNWDVSNIEDAGWMFYNCASVTELDVANWDTSSMNFTKSMFYNNIKVTELDVSNWDMSDVTDTSYMFSYCTTLGDIDFSKWDVSNVQKFNNMFKHARAMTTLDLSTWDTSSADDMNHMFANCGNLRYLDISGFDTSKVTTMAWMFYEIEAEKIYVGDKWSLASIANLDEGVYSHKIATAPLVGGEGTTCQQIMDLDSKCVAEKGARINATARYMIADGGSEKPGLLTYKAN